MGGVPQRVATYSAREVSFGMAGDRLWKVAPLGMFKFRTIKWIPVGKLQSAPRLFKYWIREDGEWINYQDKDIDEISKKMGVRFVQEDMRLQRLATERLLEQRMLDKTWWQKWESTIMTIMMFLVVAICMVIMFYQFGKIQEQQLANENAQLENNKVQLEISKEIYKLTGKNIILNAGNQTTGEEVEGLVPTT